jgi:hypothetical protein
VAREAVTVTVVSADSLWAVRPMSTPMPPPSTTLRDRSPLPGSLPGATRPRRAHL